MTLKAIKLLIPVILIAAAIAGYAGMAYGQQPENESTPQNVTISSITTSGATANWNSASPWFDYNIRRVSDNQLIINSMATHKPISFSGLSPATNYKFSVRGCASGGVNCGSFASRNFTTLAGPTLTVPGQVTGLTATAGNAEVALSWTAPSDGGSEITRYEYQQDGGSWTTTGGTETTFTKTGLTNDTSYSFKVRAVNAVGNGAESASVSATPKIPPTPTPTPTPVPPTVPGQVTGLTATAGNLQVTLSWTAPSDGGSSITKYEYQQDQGTWATTGGTGTTVVKTGLSYGTEYHFRIRAVNALAMASNRRRFQPPHIRAVNLANS